MIYVFIMVSKEADAKVCSITIGQDHYGVIIVTSTNQKVIKIYLKLHVPGHREAAGSSMSSDVYLYTLTFSRKERR